MIKYYPKKVYGYIADLYNLGQIKEIRPLYRGYGGSAKVKVLTQKGSFVISKNILSDAKDIISKSKKSLQYEIDMLSTIKGLPVPEFVISKNKKYIESVEDEYVTVYNFIEGVPPKKINSEKAYELGKFLGAFHSQGTPFKKNISTRRKFYDLTPRTMKVMRPLAYKQTNQALLDIVQTIEQGVIKNHPTSSLPQGPIHVDIGHNNELFKGNKLTGIIDFGNFYRGPFVVDIGKTIMWNCCTKGKLNQNLMQRFLDGYKTKRHLNKEEEFYIEKSILYAIYSHIWVDLYHVPIKYVPESWPLYLIKEFIPIAKFLEKGRR